MSKYVDLTGVEWDLGAVGELAAVVIPELDQWIDRVAIDRARDMLREPVRPPRDLSTAEAYAWAIAQNGRLRARVEMLASRLERGLG